MSVPDLRSTATLLEEGQTAKARVLLEDLIARVPTYVAAHVLLARIAESEKRFDSALEHWQIAYGLYPTSPVIEDGLRKAVLRVLLDKGEHSTSQVENETDVDFDNLIRELEAARIVPDPDIDTISETELENDIEDLVSETLARIYATQKYYAEAQETYETLARQHPDRRYEFETKAIEMAKLARESD